MQKFSLNIQKIFEGYQINFSKSSRNQSLYEKMSLDKEGKNAQPAKTFSHHVKTFAWSYKNHFLQPRKPRLRTCPDNALKQKPKTLSFKRRSLSDNSHQLFWWLLMLLWVSAIQKHQISKIGYVTLLYEQIGHYLAQLVAPQSGLHVIEPPM